jgi:hypothetical protein
MGLQGAFLQSIAQLLAKKATSQTARVRLITNRKKLCRGFFKPHKSAVIVAGAKRYARLQALRVHFNKNPLCKPSSSCP